MGRMIVTMMAAIAEFEAGLIGERTKAGLKEAKRQGKEWGGTNPKSLQIKHEAMARAEALRPILTELADLPALTVAGELNRRKVKTPAGGKWHAVQVIRVRERLAPAERCVRSLPGRLYSFMRWSCLRAITRMPSCLISWSHSAPEGAHGAPVGRQGGMKPEGSVRGHNDHILRPQRRGA